MNNGRIIRTFFGIGILIITSIYIYYQFQNSNVDFKNIELINQQKILYILIPILLMPVNWLLESIKWRFALNPFFSIDLKTAIKAVTGTISLSIITPNRIGEIGGRAFFLEKQFGKKAIVITALTSFSQLIITILFASFSIPYILNPLRPYLFVFIILAIIITLSFIYLRNIINRFNSIKVFKRFSEIKKIEEISHHYLFKILTFSFFRYCIFIIQYLMLLNYFNVDITIINGIAGVGGTYGLSSIVPSIAIAELGLRGSASIICFGAFSSNIEGIISATFVLWAINIALPSLLGISYWFKKTKKE